MDEQHPAGPYPAVIEFSFNGGPLLDALLLAAARLGLLVSITTRVQVTSPDDAYRLGQEMAEILQAKEAVDTHG